MPRARLLPLLLLALSGPLFAGRPQHLVRVGDRLTFARAGQVSVFYVQNVLNTRSQLVVYSMDAQIQYYMDLAFLDRHVLRIERKSRCVYRAPE